MSNILDNKTWILKGDDNLTVYKLYSNNNKTIVEGSLAEVMEELFKISEKESIPYEITKESNSVTKFRFEGYYCDFSIFIEELIW